MKLKDLADVHGLENIMVLGRFAPLRSMFGISWTSSDDELVFSPAYLSDKKWSLVDNYKITIVPEIPGLASDDMYIMDFESICERGGFEIVIRTEPRFNRCLCGSRLEYIDDFKEPREGEIWHCKYCNRSWINIDGTFVLGDMNDIQRIREQMEECNADC